MLRMMPTASAQTAKVASSITGLQCCKALSDLSQNRSGINVHIFECDVCRVMRVDGRITLSFDARAVSRNGKQGDAVLIRLRATGTSRNDKKIVVGTIQNKVLLSIQDVFVAICCCICGDICNFKTTLRLREGECRLNTSIDNAGQPLLFLLRRCGSP